MDAYERLANAIILQAVKDYRRTLKRLSRRPHDSDIKKDKMDLEELFRSDWFSTLTSLDPEVLIEKLTSEVSA